MDKNRNYPAMIIGIILIVLGLLAIFGRFFVLPDMDNLWPLIIILVGVAFFAPLLMGEKKHGNLAVPGSILVTIGAILFFMNRTDSWEAWSYCWALIVCAVGVGTWLNGITSDKPELQKRGLNVLRTGLILFVVFGVIMEFIFSLSGEAHWGGILFWSVLLALVGAYLLVTRLLKMRTPDGERVDLFWPVLMIGAGLAAAIADLGGISGFSSGRLFYLLPLLLIAAGLGLIFRSRSPWLGLFLGALVVAGLFVILFAGGALGLDAASGWDFGPIDFGGSRQVLVASGHEITETRPISGVTGVKLETSVELVIRQGSTESLVVTGDEAILPALLTTTSLGQLTIRYDPRYEIRGNQRPRLELTVKDLAELRISSSGSVTVETLTTDNFNLVLSSSCEVRIEDIHAGRISVRLSSSGDILMQGEAESLDLDVSSSGNFQAGDLQVQEADVTLTSSGEVTLWVVDELLASISSSGNISYYGSPVVRQNLSSSGELISLGNK